MNMKNILAASTALSAVALLASAPLHAAEKPKVSVGGYYDIFLGGGDVPAGGTNSGTPIFTSSQQEDGAISMLTYGEIKIQASGATDSGMKWGTYFEISVDDAARVKKAGSTSASEFDGKFAADEANMYLSGSWGRLELGNQDGAADKMRTSGNAVDLLGSNIIGAFADVKGDVGIDGADQANTYDSGDNTKVTYYSPRVNGVQAGVSFIPKHGAIGTMSQQDGERKTASGYELGLGWKGKLSNTTTEVVGTYTTGPSEGAPGTLDHSGYTIGAEVGMSGFTFAVGYARNKNWDVSNASTQNAYNAGIGYSMGKWSVAGYWLHMDAKQKSNGATADFNEFSLQAGYDLGGGLTAALGLYDLELKSSANPTDIGKQNDSQLVIAKLTAKF